MPSLTFTLPSQGRTAPRPSRVRPAFSATRPRQTRAARCGGVTDRAFYYCGCGYAFTAPVSTSVPCPHCGTQQAW